MYSRSQAKREGFPVHLMDKFSSSHATVRIRGSVPGSLDKKGGKTVPSFIKLRRNMDGIFLPTFVV
jgi:hypothetical protein